MLARAVARVLVCVPRGGSAGIAATSCGADTEGDACPTGGAAVAAADCAGADFAVCAAGGGVAALCAAGGGGATRGAVLSAARRGVWAAPLGPAATTGGSGASA